MNYEVRMRRYSVEPIMRDLNNATKPKGDFTMQQQEVLEAIDQVTGTVESIIKSVDPDADVTTHDAYKRCVDLRDYFTHQTYAHYGDLWHIASDVRTFIRTTIGVVYGYNSSVDMREYSAYKTADDLCDHIDTITTPTQ